MIRFDAYSATMVGPKAQDLAQILVDQVGLLSGMSMHQGKGFHTFAERLSIKDDTGSELGSVSWGGRQGDRVMFEVKGERSPGAVEALRSRFPHRCTRVDACADFDAPGAFQRLLGPCEEVIKVKGIYAERRGDWEQFPELGRTYMMGSAKSAVRCRLYEKGRQPEYRHLARDNWARIELQVRPAKEAKEAFSQLTPGEVWGASGWTRELASRVLEQHIDPHPAGTTYRLTERDAALRWMCQQYGGHLVSLAQDLGGWDCLGLTLGEMFREAQLQRKRGLQ